jgi:uncharacterized membrane protein YeaQ/YmgE (transglycosylase-associated protein family)
VRAERLDDASLMTDRHDVVVARRDTGPCLQNARGALARVDKREGKDSMGIIAWIVLGAIAGFIATLITGTREGIVMTIILGIVGALVGGFLAGVFLNLKDPTGINVETIVVSVIGAIIVVFVAGLFGSGKRRGSV